MSDEFRREFLVQLPLPLAQLYGRAYNAKDGRARHDNSFYCFEAAIKLAACPLIACYIDEVQNGAAHNSKLDKQLAQIALPSLGQWVGFLRETSRYFGQRADSATHPLGHVWNQLNEKHRTLPCLLALYRRIRNGPDAKQAGDNSCSILQLLESIVQYRNLVFGHGAGRTESFYEVEMGPLLFPALNDLFNDGVFDFLGPANSRLVFLNDLKKVDEGTSQLELKELTGTQSTRLKPICLTNQQSSGISPQSVAVLWPSRPTPLVLEPLLTFREDDFVEEVLFVNCDRNNKHVEFLSYTTGRTEKNAEMAPLMVHLLSIVSGQKVTKTKIGDMQHASLLADAESNAYAVPVDPPVSVEGRLIQGDFEILGEIGRGGMGVVYLARQLSLGRPVALKMLHPNMAGNPESLARFKREIATLARCDHPHIVKVLSAGKMPNGEYYYAMEYVSGSDLELVWSHLAENKASDSTSKLDASVWAKAVLNASTSKRSSIAKRTKSPISAQSDEATEGETSSRRVKGGDTVDDEGPPSLFQFDVQQLPRRIRHFEQTGNYVHQIASMIRDAADGLQALHDRDIVHRDIKPSNMVLTADGSRVVLMDFGLAKSANQSMAQTRAGGFMGTLRYAAPEQLAASTMKVGPQADIRGLGVTMWELITRRQLFDDVHDEMQLAQAIIHRDVPLLRSVDPTIEADLEAIVARATERQLSDRLQTARQFVELLDLYLDGKPLPIRSPSRSELIRRQFQAYSLPIKLMAATAAIVLVWIAASIWQRHSSPSQPTKLAAAVDLELLTVTSFSGSSWLERAPWLLPKLRGDISAEISKSQSNNLANDERQTVRKPVIGQETLLNSNASIMRSDDVDAVLNHLQLGFSRHLSQTTGPTADVLESLQAWDPREVIEDPQERLAIKDKILDGLKLIGDPHALAVYAAHFDQGNIETGIDPDLEFKRAEQAYKSQGDAAKGLLALCYADWAQYLATQSTHESSKHAANKFAKARETIVEERLAPLLFAECYCGEANARRKLRQWASVEECLRNAERITQEYAAEHHPLAAYIQERLAWQYMDQWKVLQAKTAFEKAITTWEYWDQRLANDDDGANDFQLTVSTSRFADEHGLAMVERYLGNNTEAIRRYSELPRQIRDLRNQQDDAAARLRLSSRLVNTKERLADCSLLQAQPQLKSAVLNYRQAIDDFPDSQRGNQLQMPPTMLQYKRVIASILDLDGDQDSSASTLVGLKKELDEIEKALEAYEQGRQELTGKAYERDHLLDLYVQSAQLLLDLNSNHDPATIESLRDLVDQEIARNSNENLKRDNLDLLLFLSDRILRVAMKPEDASRPFKLVPEVWRLNVLNYLRPYHDRALSALMTTGTTDLSVLADYISKAKTGQPLDDLNSKSIIVFYSATTSDSQLTIDSALIHHVDGSGQIVKLKQPIVIKSNDVDQEMKSIPWPDELMIENSAGQSTFSVHWHDDVTGLNRGNFPWLTTLPKNSVLIDSPPKSTNTAKPVPQLD